MRPTVGNLLWTWVGPVDLQRSLLISKICCSVILFNRKNTKKCLFFHSIVQTDKKTSVYDNVIFCVVICFWNKLIYPHAFAETADTLRNQVLGLIRDLLCPVSARQCCYNSLFPQFPIPHVLARTEDEMVWSVVTFLWFLVYCGII